MVNTKIIADLPIELGIKRTYKGYFFLIAALELANLFFRLLQHVMELHTVVLNVTSEQQSTPVGIRQIVKNC